MIRPNVTMAKVGGRLNSNRLNSLPNPLGGGCYFNDIRWIKSIEVKGG